MPDLRAVVPAVLLGEVAPADTSDRNESSLNVDITPPSEAAVSENGDADPGEGPCHLCAISDNKCLHSPAWSEVPAALAQPGCHAIQILQLCMCANQVFIAVS